MQDSITIIFLYNNKRVSIEITGVDPSATDANLKSLAQDISQMTYMSYLLVRRVHMYEIP